MANSALALGLKDEAIRLYTEVVANVPALWPLQNRLAEASMDVGRPEPAVEILEESLNITGDSGHSSQARKLLELANEKLEEQQTANPDS